MGLGGWAGLGGKDGRKGNEREHQANQKRGEGEERRCWQLQAGRATIYEDQPEEEKGRGRVAFSHVLVVVGRSQQQRTGMGWSNRGELLGSCRQGQHRTGQQVQQERQLQR